MQPYTNTGPLDCSKPIDYSQLKGKSAIVTGGASGLGEAYVKAFAKHGAYVTICDIDETNGKRVLKEIKNAGGDGQFVICDVTKWADQVSAFEAAVQNSPAKAIDIVLANAGTGARDNLFKIEDPSTPPEEPNLLITNVNMIGVMYTVKLALYHFQSTPKTPDHDRCLILKASIAGYLALPGSLQYCATKYAVRGLIQSLRFASHTLDVRVNASAPWFIETPIMSMQLADHLKSSGIELATPANAAKLMCRFACDKSIHGRTVAVVPESMAKSGNVDVDHDDYVDPDPLYNWQQGAFQALHGRPS